MIGRNAGVMADLDREAAAGAPPQVAVVAGRLWQGLPGLLGANLIFLARCAPFGLLSLLGLPILALAVAPLTVGPGLVALVTAAARVVEDLPAGARSTRRPAVRTAFGAGAVLASAFLLAWHAQLIALRAVVSHGATPATIALWGAEIAVLVLGLLVGVHALALVGLHGQGFLEATRNGFVLAVRHPGPTVAMLGLIGVGAALAWTLAGAPLVMVPGVLAFLLVNTTQRLVAAGGHHS